MLDGAMADGDEGVIEISRLCFDTITAKYIDAMYLENGRGGGDKGEEFFGRSQTKREEKEKPSGWTGLIHR